MYGLKCFTKHQKRPSHKARAHRQGNNMTESFTAENGVVITTDEHGDTQILENGTNLLDNYNHLSPDEMTALREFTLHGLSLWQDALSGAIVLRETGRDDADGRCITVFQGGVATRHWDGMNSPAGELAGIKARYFAAHPKPAPDPWLEAKPGEAWQLTVDGTTGAYVLTPGGTFYGVTHGDLCNWGKGSDLITAGVRMVAESEATE